MNWTIIKTKKQYNQAFHRLEEIFDAKKNTPEGDELELLSLLIEHYENKHFAIENPDPIEAIKFKLKQLGLKQQDLANIEAATKELNDSWMAASQDMYNATQGAEAGAQSGPEQAGATNAENVTDAEFEEVK